MPESDLISVLRERQQREGLDDAEFAAKLGVSRQMWSHIRHGIRVPGRKTLNGIITSFPEYAHLAAFFVIQNATNMSDEASNSSDEKTLIEVGS